MNRKLLVLLGIRGIPASHGGFETFAQHLCLYLVKKEWDVVVYCQEAGKGEIHESHWKGIRLIHIPVVNEGPVGTLIFDLKSIIHSRIFNGIFLTLGYNSAIFSALLRVFRKVNIINMDGIEWKRAKWGVVPKIWFLVNELIGCYVGNHLVADHPEIKNHLATRVNAEKITMIPYGADIIEGARAELLNSYGVNENKYMLTVARIEPENSILEIVRSFSSRPRGIKLLVLGDLDPERKDYHRDILESAGDEVIFPGSIYNPEHLSALRYYALAYIHGHQVGGTNPSLVEALGAGNAVIANDNKFNRWVARGGALYFKDEVTIDDSISKIIDDDKLSSDLSAASTERYMEAFQWKRVLQEYEHLLSVWHS